MALRVSELREGQVFEQIVVEDLKRTQIVMYAGASGDFHPFHSDEAFARAAGSSGGVFGHGMLTMAMTGRLLTDTVGDGRLTHYTARFVGQVWPGDTLTARATVVRVSEEAGESLAHLDVDTSNQHGVSVLTGTATARVDP